MSKIKPNISDSIAETLFITLCAKSVESRKKKPLISDPKACEILDKVDYDCSKFSNAKASTTGVAIRANHFDNMVRQFIERHDDPVVLLIGCGLDTRVHRLGAIAGKALFYHLDIPEVIACRQQLIPAGANETYIPGSMLSTDWMDDIASRHAGQHIIIIIEGVLMYFSESDNQLVFREIAKRFKGATIHFDMLNRFMSKRSSIHDTVKKTRAAFRFGTDDVREIENWAPNLRHYRTYKFYEFKGWQRMGALLTILMLAIPAFKNASRLLTYKVV